MATEYRVKRGETVQSVTVLEDRGETVLVAIDGQRLELAVVGFFQNFRKVYVGEQVRAESAGALDKFAVVIETCRPCVA